MASFYITTDNEGNEVRQAKGRGPTRKGFVQRDDGNWVPDPGYEKLSKPAVSASEDKVYVRFNPDSGVYENHKRVTRGRRATGYVQFKVEDGRVSLLEPDRLPENADLLTIPVDLIVGECTDWPVQIVGRKVTQFVRNEEPSDLDVLLKSIKGVQRKSGSQLGFTLCDIYPYCPLSELKSFSSASRIDIDLDKGEVSIWQIEYREGNPDVVITNAFTPNYQSA